MAAFEAGDRVAWSHSYATDHAEGSIVKTDVVSARAPDAMIGEVVKVANEEGTYFEVKFDGEAENMTFTADELVKVADQ